MLYVDVLPIFSDATLVLRDRAFPLKAERSPCSPSAQLFQIPMFNFLTSPSIADLCLCLIIKILLCSLACFQHFTHMDFVALTTTVARLRLHSGPKLTADYLTFSKHYSFIFVAVSIRQHHEAHPRTHFMVDVVDIKVQFVSWKESAPG
jgi:hypothetical protein